MGTLLNSRILKRFYPYKYILRKNIGSEANSLITLIKDIEKKKYNDYHFLVGTPLHDNLGDHLLAMAEKSYLKDVCGLANIMEIPLDVIRMCGSQIATHINPRSIIFVNGGGWMGDVWPHDEILLQDIATDFRNNKVIVFPQTVYYSNLHSKKSQELLSRAKQSYNDSPNLTLSFRERRSYEFALREFEKCDVVLAPDMALSYLDEAPKNQHKNDHKIGLCLRSDREKASNEDILNAIFDYFDSEIYEFLVVDTIAPSRVLLNDRVDTVNELLNRFAECDLVITDRLHGMLCSYLTDTPCIVLDNATNKVLGVYHEWLIGSQKILFVKRFNDLKRVAEFVDTQNRTPANSFPKEKFDEITRRIKSQF